MATGLIFRVARSQHHAVFRLRRASFANWHHSARRRLLARMSRKYMEHSLKTIRTAALAAVTGAVAAVAFPTAGMAQMNTADSSWYVGGHVGRADWDRANDEDT